MPPTLAETSFVVYLNDSSVGVATLMYVDDSNGAFPAAPPVAAIFDPMAWVSHSSARGLADSRIAPYLSGFNAEMLLCPAYRPTPFIGKPGLIRILQGMIYFGYPYHYKLSAGRLDQDPLDWLPGMASDFRYPEGRGVFQLTSVRNPSTKIMVAEHLLGNESASSVEQYRDRSCGWLWRHGERLTSRHRGKASVAMADGHVETVAKTFGDSREHSDPVQ